MMKIIGPLFIFLFVVLGVFFKMKEIYDDAGTGRDVIMIIGAFLTMYWVLKLKREIRWRRDAHLYGFQDDATDVWVFRIALLILGIVVISLGGWILLSIWAAGLFLVWNSVD